MRSRVSRKAGFTLVELLVVIGIIALLISILLPSLNRAREAANRVKCGSNLRSIGQSAHIFAAENKGRLPYQLTGGWGTPWWGTWMYSPDWTDLIDTYGAARPLFQCPSVPTYSEGLDYDIGFGNLQQNGHITSLNTSSLPLDPVPAGTGVQMDWDPGNEERHRQGLAVLEAFGLNLRTPSEIAPGGDYGAWGWSAPGANEIANVLHLSFLQFSSYQYMGGDGTEIDIQNAFPFEVLNLTHKTTTMQTPLYLGSAEYDTNPPLMCDIMWQETQDGGATWVSMMNHGKSWTVMGPIFDPTIWYLNRGATDPLDDALLGASEGHRGDVRGNVLYRDGHVEIKSPDEVSYMTSGRKQFFR